MSRAGRWNTQAIAGLIMLVIGVVAAVVLALAIPSGAPLHSDEFPAATGQVTGAALGKEIFQTGRDENGRPIPRSGGMGMMGRAVACANCHGSDARGRTIQRMMGQIDTPDIRWSALTAPPTDPADKAFDPDSFFPAVTQGADPDGSVLKRFMPRWRLTRAESDSLIEYLKTL